MTSRENATLDGRTRPSTPNIRTLKKLLRLKRALGLEPRLTGAEARNQSATLRELRLAMTSPATRSKIRDRDKRRERLQKLREYAP